MYIYLQVSEGSTVIDIDDSDESTLEWSERVNVNCHNCVTGWLVLSQAHHVTWGLSQVDTVDTRYLY